jgi:hypothetical protein
MSERIVYNKDKISKAIKADLAAKGLKVCDKHLQAEFKENDSGTDVSIEIVVCGGIFECDCKNNVKYRPVTAEQAEPTGEEGPAVSVDELDLDDGLFT